MHRAGHQASEQTGQQPWRGGRRIDRHYEHAGARRLCGQGAEETLDGRNRAEPAGQYPNLFAGRARGRRVHGDHLAREK